MTDNNFDVIRNLRGSAFALEVMVKRFKLSVLVLSAALVLGGCQSAGEKETVGTVVGAVAGGIVGAQFGHGAGRVVGGAIGALFGGLIGNRIGASMDGADQAQANTAFVKATRVPVGETVYWNNSHTGHWGSYRPVRDGESRMGYYCREFVTTVHVHGRTEKLYGTACRKPDGSWHAI